MDISIWKCVAYLFSNIRLNSTLTIWLVIGCKMIKCFHCGTDIVPHGGVAPAAPTSIFRNSWRSTFVIFGIKSWSWCHWVTLKLETSWLCKSSKATCLFLGFFATLSLRLFSHQQFCCFCLTEMMLIHVFNFRLNFFFSVVCLFCAPPDGCSWYCSKITLLPPKNFWKFSWSLAGLFTTQLYGCSRSAVSCKV